MTEQYDFLQLSVCHEGDSVQIGQGGDTVRATVHQLPDLIRTLQQINAQAQSEMAKRNIESLQRDLRGGTDLRPVNGRGPQGAA